MLLASSASSSGNSNFLIPNGTFIAELLMFLIVLGIIAKFILPPLQKAMDDRAATIRGGMEAGEEGHAEADRLAVERRETLEHAHVEARAILEEATRTAEHLREEARARGLAEFESRLAAAVTEIDSERAQLREETLARLGAVVVDAAQRVIGAAVDPTRHEATIAEAIAGASHGEGTPS